MNAKNVELEDFSCELNEQDLNDIRDIIEIGRVYWNRREKQTIIKRDSVFRLYTQYDPDNSSNITFDVAKALYFPLQPSFYRCCASTGNRKIYGIFEKLVRMAINYYNQPFSMVVCILAESTVEPHVHLIDPDKNITTTTYYWTLTNHPVDCDFIYRDQRMPMYRQGQLELDPTVMHGVDFRDSNMRFFVAIDSV